MYSELAVVVLRHGLPEHGLRAGDVGTVVASCDAGGYVVEFLTADGDTVAVETLQDIEIRPMAEREILHVRAVEQKAAGA